MLTYLTTILVIQELWCGFSMVFGAPYPQIANTTCPLPPIAKQIIAWYLKPFPTVIRRSKGKEEMRRKREHVPLQVPVISWQEMIKCWPYITVGGGGLGGLEGRETYFLTTEQCQISVGEDDEIIKHFPCVVFITSVLFFLPVTMEREQRSPFSASPRVLLPRGSQLHK